MVKVPFNSRLILFSFVVAVVGMTIFTKLGTWYFFCTAAVALVLIIYFVLTIGKKSRREPPDSCYRPFVSVMIPACNEEEVIARVVEQAMGIDYSRNGEPGYDVWVIDDRSTDETSRILRQLKKCYPGLNVMFRKQDDFPGKAAALNHCLPETRGQVLLVLDADAEFSADIISKSVGYLAPENVGGAQVAKRISNPLTNVLCTRQADEYKVDISVQLGRDSVGGVVEFKGNGSFIKRSVLLDVGGWSNYTITEDLDLSTKMLMADYRIRFVPEVAVWEQAAPDTWSLLRQRLRWTEGSMLRYLIHLPSLIKGGMHLRRRFDMAMFLFEFAIPLWVFFDLLSQPVLALMPSAGLRFSYMNFPLSLINLGIIMGGLVVAVAIKLVAQYIREKRYSFFQILIRTPVTMFYMLHWFPVVLAATFNLIFGLESRKWKKARRISSEQVSQG